MRFNEPGIQRLACDIVQSFIHNELFDKSNLDGFPQIAVTALTGQRLQIKGKSQKEIISSFDDILSVPKSNNELDARLSNNCRIISQAMDIEIQCEPLIRLGALCTINFGLNDLINAHLYYTNENLNMMIASALGMELMDLEIVIISLSKSRLFRQHSADLLSILKLPKELVQNMVNVDATCFQQLVNGLFEVQPKSVLSLNDFPHLQLDYLTLYLKQVVKQQICGINILLHGPSGTGKTELSKLLAQCTKSGLMTVKAQGEEYQEKEDELTSTLNAATLRLQYHNLLNAMLSNEPNTLLLIDECEDVFYEYLSGKKVSKDRLHQVLSDNPIPTIWITNHVNQLEESCIRRFSYVLEVPTPPKAIKMEIISKPLSGLYVSQAFKHSLSQIEDLTPAHVNQAANVARLLNIKGSTAQHCIEEHIEQTLSACGLTLSTPRYRAEIPFDKQFINIKGDMNSIDELIKAVTTFDGTKALLFGEAGTGKTALVNHLAETLEQELITIKCSDVLGKYVGESEGNVASIFKKAHQQSAILFLDEVDSLLSSRSSLMNQFERQLVNEFLQQIEQSELTIFAASNHAQMIDKAALRRFDFKLTLDYLNQQQVLKLYQDVIGNISNAEQQQLIQLKQLTAGDFAIVARRNRLSRKPLTHVQNIRLLQEENNSKQKHQSIGFVH
jgi:AAA+ superfamily predicted ATPase